MRRRLLMHAGLSLALALPATAGIAATLDIAHVAPTVGMVRIQIGEAQATTLDAYRDVAFDVEVASGISTLRAIDAGNNVVAERSIDIHDDDEQFIALVGNGSAVAPIAFARSFDHNRPLADGSVSVQIASAAIVLDDEGERVSFPSRLQCGSDADNRTLRYLDGFDRSGNLKSLSPSPTCGHFGTIDGEHIATQIAATANERLRIVFIGDGSNQPYESLLIRQGLLEARPEMPANASIDGLWFVPSVAAAGISLTFSPVGEDPFRVKGIYYGYDADGDATWTFLDGPRQYLYRGGSFDGVRPTVRYEQHTQLLMFHSCHDATLLTDAGGLGQHMFEPRPYPRNAVRLHKLLPIGPCDTETQP